MILTKEDALQALKENVHFKDLPQKFKEDREVVKEAVKYDCFSLKYAGAKFQDDKEIVLIAVSSCGWAYEYVSERLQNDKEVLLTALENFKNNISWVSNFEKNIPTTLAQDEDAKNKILECENAILDHEYQSDKAMMEYYAKNYDYIMKVRRGEPADQTAEPEETENE